MPRTAIPARTPDCSSVEQDVRDSIRAYARAWVSGDIPAIAAMYHPGFTLNYFGRNALARRHIGKSAAIEALGEFRKRTGRKLVKILAEMSGPERGGLVSLETMQFKGATVSVERVYLYTVQRGLLRECWVYDQDQRQIDEIIAQ